METRSTQFQRIAVIGAIANPNAGDEAILEENLRLIDAMLGAGKVVYVFSKDPSYTALTSLGSAVPINYLHRLTLRSGFDFDLLREICDAAIAYDPKNGYDADFEAIHSILSGIDVLHIIGGGYLNSLWPDMIEEVRVAALLAHRYGARAIATGIGVNPLYGKALERFADIVEVCESVDFRDGSIDQLPEEMRAAYAGKLAVTTDDAVAFGRLAPERWFARVPHEIKTASTGSYLNIALHCNDAVRESGLLESSLALAYDLFGKGLIDHVNFLGFSPDDLDLLEGGAADGAACPVNLIPLAPHPAISAWLVVANAVANVGTRYHQAVFSLAAGVPVLSLAINDYYICKLEGIHSQVGSKNVLPVGEASADALLAFGSSLDEIKSSLAHAASDFEERRARKLEVISHVYSNKTEGADELLERAMDPCPVKVSVIVPIFNMERYLRECLDSILSQSLAEIEVICVDDGSTDSSAKILYEYSWNDHRVKVMSQANSGVASARNAGLKAATGEFVFFVDPDDWLASENVLMALYWAAKNNGALAACGGFAEYVVGEDGSRDNPKEVITSWGENFSGFAMPSEGMVSYKDYQFDYGWIRFIYDRHTLVSNGLWFPHRKFYEDPVWFTRVMDTIGEFYATGIPAYCYRRGHKATTISRERVIDLFRGMTDILELSKERGYDLLWSLTYSRLTHDYVQHISPVICTETADPEVDEALARLNAAIVDGGGAGNVERIIIRNAERERADREIAVLRGALDAATRDFEAARSKFDLELSDEIARIKDSRTWKVGSVVWWGPRKIREIIDSRQSGEAER